MTNEEAIMVLKCVMCHGSLTTKARDLAIKSLSQCVNIDKIKEAIRIKCERDYMDGDIIADELLEIIDKIVRGEEA